MVGVRVAVVVVMVKVWLDLECTMYRSSSNVQQIQYQIHKDNSMIDCQKQIFLSNMF